MNTDILDGIWRFIRGDTPIDLFASWAYAEPALEEAVGLDVYLDLISADYGDPRAVANLKARLTTSLPPPSCKCHIIPDRAMIVMGGWPLSTCDLVEREANAIPWMHLLHCPSCDTSWLLAAEELVYDVWLVSRQAGTDWPEVRTYGGLLTTALRMGAAVTYHDPLNSIELPMAIRALASETPGIALTDIVELLPVERSVAQKHALSVMADAHIRIDLEG